MPNYALAPSILSPISALPATPAETRAPESAACRTAQRPEPDLARLEHVLAAARQQRGDHVAGLLRGAWRAVPNGRRRTVLRAGALVLLVLALFAGYDAALDLGGIDSPFGANVIILVAATLSSIAGFAFSPLCGAMLLHVLGSPVDVVKVLLVCSMGIQLTSVVALWRRIDWRSLPPFMIGGLLGVPAGVALLLHLPATSYRVALGGLLVAYAAYRIVARPVTLPQSGRLSDVGAGLVGGITGGLAGFPGAFVTIWCGMKPWDKQRQRGVYQPFILAMQPVALAAIYLMQPKSASSAAILPEQALTFIPAALVGAWLGIKVFMRLSDRQFAVVVNVLLMVSGFGLIA
jgi:hypothetical protein